LKGDNALANPRILITGGSGFIGTNLVAYCAQAGDQVLNFDRCPPRNPLHREVWRQVDLLDQALLQKEIQAFDPHYIYHLAARTDLDGRSLEEYADNTVGVSNLIAASKTLPHLKRIIFASSRLVCRIDHQPKNEFDYCPSTYYGESKVVGEKIVRDNADTPYSWVIVRPTSIWGPWFDIPYKIFFLAIAQGRYFHPGNLNIYKSFGYIGNAVYILDQLMRIPSERVHGKLFYLEDYPPINLKKMADFIQETMGVRKIQSLPLWPLLIGAAAGDFLKATGWKNPPLTRFRLNNLITNMVYDSTPLEKIVGDLPYTMEQGVVETVNWMYQRGEIKQNII
jgi:GlcNAc-P-P-Und epimerase